MKTQKRLRQMMFGALLGGCLCAGAPGYGQWIDAPSSSKEPSSRAKVLTGIVDYTPPASGSSRDDLGSYRITGLSRLKIVKVLVRPEDGESTFAVDLTTSQIFDAKELGHLLIQVGGQIFIPSGIGAHKQQEYDSIILQHVPPAIAQILSGAPLANAPKDSLKIEYKPDNSSVTLGTHFVTIIITNIGKTPITFEWGATGVGNYPCRDSRLSFTATQDGALTPPNAKPLPAGFIVSHITLKLGDSLNRQENLCEWLQMDKPGRYTVSSAYTIDIQNTTELAPTGWSVVYKDRFDVTVDPLTKSVSKIDKAN